MVSMSDQIIRKAITFSGAVQGVGFRYRAQWAADGCGVVGWVRNKEDGTVDMEAQGTEQQINELLKIINRSQYISIDQITYRDIPVEENATGFHIRR